MRDITETQGLAMTSSADHAPVQALSNQDIPTPPGAPWILSTKTSFANANMATQVKFTLSNASIKMKIFQSAIKCQIIVS